MATIAVSFSVLEAIGAAQKAGHTDEAIAEAIAALPEPVDPLLVMAREAAARAAEANNDHADAAAFRANERDDWYSVQSALEALRMAKEQGLPE